MTRAELERTLGELFNAKDDIINAIDRIDRTGCIGQYKNEYLNLSKIYDELTYIIDDLEEKEAERCLN